MEHGGNEKLKEQFTHISFSSFLFFCVFPVLVDKDQSPKWSPSTLEEVSDQMVDQCFSSLGDKDLTL